MTAYELIRYVDEQFEIYKIKSWTTTGYRDMESLLNSYRDYLSMCKALEYDSSNNFVLYPVNLPKAHGKINDLSDKEQAEVYEGQIRKLYEKLNSQYAFSGYGYFIALPRTVKEVIEEGHKPCHCIRTYVKIVVRKQYLVFFVRKVNEPEKPLCTVELNGAKIGQTSTSASQAPTPPIEVFLEEWEQEILQAPVLQSAA